MIQEKLVQEFINKHTIGWLEEDFAMMYRDFPRNRETITASLAAGIAQVCREARLLQHTGRKGPAAYIFISFLRTSIVDNIWQYRIDLYDENFLFDRTECSGHWHMDYVWDYLKKRLDRMAVAANSGIYANKIRAYRLEEIKLAKAAEYHQVAVELTKMVIKDAIRIPEYDDLIKAPDLKILMGEYQDHSVLIYEE